MVSTDVGEQASVAVAVSLSRRSYLALIVVSVVHAYFRNFLGC